MRILLQLVPLVKPLPFGHFAGSFFRTDIAWIPWLGLGLLVVIRSLVVYSTGRRVKRGY